MKRIVFSFILAGAAACGTAWSVEQEKVGPTADMAKWETYATPSAGHRVLDAMVGEWDYTLQFSTGPGAPPEESKGVSVTQWIMGGRYLRHDVTGAAMGRPFEGMGFTAFDNLAQHYESVWIDSMGTGITRSTGRYDAPSRTLTENGTMPDALAGRNVRYRGVTKFADKDRYTYKVYSQTPAGKEYLALKIEYARKR